MNDYCHDVNSQGKTILPHIPRIGSAHRRADEPEDRSAAQCAPHSRARGELYLLEGRGGPIRQEVGGRNQVEGGH